MKSWDVGHVPLRSKAAKQLLSHISSRYSTLAFCKRYLARDGVAPFDASLTQLVKVTLVSFFSPAFFFFFSDSFGRRGW